MLNSVALVGRLTAAPELKHTPNDTPVTAFTLAVERSRTVKGQDRQTDFIPVVAWRQAAEFVCKYFTKGQMMAVSGTLQSRSFEDREGTRRTAYEVRAEEISFCGGRTESGGANSAHMPDSSTGKTAGRREPKAVPDPAEYLDDSDLPF